MEKLTTAIFRPMKSIKTRSAWKYIKNDLQTYYRINGCKNFVDFIGIFLFYPQIWALMIYRIGHAIKNRNRLIYKLYVYLLWNPIRLITSIEIWPQATIGTNFFIAHFGNVLIHPKTIIGDNCILAGGCAMGLIFDGGDEAPILEDGVRVGIGAIIIGNVRVGKNSMVGPNAVVTVSVPDNAVVVGNPARVVRRMEE